MSYEYVSEEKLEEFRKSPTMSDQLLWLQQHFSNCCLDTEEKNELMEDLLRLFYEDKTWETEAAYTFLDDILRQYITGAPFNTADYMPLPTVLAKIDRYVAYWEAGLEPALWAIARDPSDEEVKDIVELGYFLLRYPGDDLPTAPDDSIPQGIVGIFTEHHLPESYNTYFSVYMPPAKSSWVLQ